MDQYLDANALAGIVLMPGQEQGQNQQHLTKQRRLLAEMVA